MKLTWKRTVIAGDELHHDFCAYADNIAVARIKRSQDAEHRTFWSVNFHIGSAASDACLTRQDAIQWVEHQFALFLAGHAGIEQK